VTKWVDNWLHQYEDHPNIIPATLMARLFNQPATLDYLGFPEEWEPEAVKSRLRNLQERGDRIFNAAYIVSTNGLSMDKCEYVVDRVLTPAFAARGRLAYPDLEDMWRALIQLNGVGSFIAAQVVADLKELPPWENAADYWKFVAPGPGSMRGLNRLRGLEAKAQKYNPKAFSMYIQPLRAIIGSTTGIKLCAQNTQNCLCEFDKFMRLTLGEGRPKQKYKRTK